MSSLSDFLGEIGRHQLLTPERELTMGRKVQEMVVLINRCQEAGGKGPACEYSEAERKKIKIGEKAKNEMITAQPKTSCKPCQEIPRERIRITGLNSRGDIRSYKGRREI